MKIYVPIIGNGTQDSPFRPDIPDNIPWEAVSIPSRLRSPHATGQPVCQYALVEVADNDAHKINATSPDQVDETTKLVTTAMQAIRNPQKVEQLADRDNDDTPQACFEGAQEERHRNKIDNSIIHRRRWARLLVRLCRRGFPIKKARHIVKKHGIDRDEHNRGAQTSQSGTRGTQPGGQQDATTGGTRE